MIDAVDYYVIYYVHGRSNHHRTRKFFVKSGGSVGLSTGNVEPERIETGGTHLAHMPA